MGRKLMISLLGVLLILVAITVWARTASRPTDLGVRDGRLTACPGTPNCVSTEAGDAEPLRVWGDPERAFHELREAIRAMPRTRIVVEEPGYLHAEASTWGFGFIDDLEARLDEEAGVIHLRSASRLGHSDLGVNAKRVKDVRLRYEARVKG
jgi:uncharacterized protein (DUF1499 family)